MTGLAADVASLATGLGAVASDMARLVAIVAALHGKAAGIVATLRAAARHVTSLVAIVTTQLRSLSEKILSIYLIQSLRHSTEFPTLIAKIHCRQERILKCRQFKILNRNKIQTC